MGLIGHGSKLELGDGATPEVFTETPGLLSVDFGSNKIDSVDTTTMSSANSTREFTPGLENPGELTAKFNVIPSNAAQTALIAAKGSTKNFKVIYPGAVRTIAFTGFITGVDESIPDDKAPTFSVKIQITGPKTYS